MHLSTQTLQMPGCSAKCSINARRHTLASGLTYHANSLALQWPAHKAVYALKALREVWHRQVR